ncbi:MAG: hypothetical protein HYW49_14005 [Deltaproteobacteria bacterium]|nr:hypothetical protein [Deltaproteobacteria bacterium]
MEVINEALRAFETLFPELRKEKLLVRQRNLSDFPVWLRGAVDIYTLARLRDDQPAVTLVRPKEELAFDQLLNVYRQVSAKTGPRTLLIADRLNPKFRPLLVKFRVPFVFKAESIFAPELALMFKRLRPFENDPRPGGSPVKEKLHPLSTKLLAAYLSNQLPRQITLRELHQTLTKAGAAVSPAKLSLVLRELVHADFVETVGKGPRKAFLFAEQKTVWGALASAQLAPFMRVVRDHYLPPNDHDFVLAGESALTDFSDLNAPAALTIATTPAIYRQMRSNAVPHGDFDGPGVYIQVWKEDPRIFAIEHKINPIELYLSMREHPDERVQLALQRMLLKYGLTLMEE